jgi:hypothetical protein
MLLVVLRMPMSIETWEEDPVAVAQFIATARGAADRIERDAATIQELVEIIRLLTEKGVKQDTGLGWNERLRMARDARARALGGIE